MDLLGIGFLVDDLVDGGRGSHPRSPVSESVVFRTDLSRLDDLFLGQATASAGRAAGSSPSAEHPPGSPRRNHPGRCRRRLSGLRHVSRSSLLGHEREEVDTEVVDDRRPGDPGDGGDDHTSRRTGTARSRSTSATGLGACTVPSASSPPGADTSTPPAAREDRGQAGTEDEPHHQHLEDAFQVSHRRVLCFSRRVAVRPRPCPWRAWSPWPALRGRRRGRRSWWSASQSALTLLWSTFCCCARHHM